MINYLFIDGFDHTNGSSYSRKYEYDGGFGPYAAVAGRYSGRAINVFNTGFGKTAHRYTLSSAQTQLSIGFDFQSMGGGFGDSTFLRLDKDASFTSPNTQLALAQTAAGQIQLWFKGLNGNNFQGTLIGTTAPLIYNRWYHFELLVDGTSFKLFIDGDAATPAIETSGSIDPINGVTFRWQRFGFLGFNRDNLVIANANEQVGLCRIETYHPDENISIELGRNTGTDNYKMVYERYAFPTPLQVWDDGDSTYVHNNTANGLDIYGIPTIVSYGSVAAIAQNVTAKHMSGSPIVKAVLQRNSNNYEHALSGYNTTEYRHYQHLWTEDPETSSAWTLNTARAALWGVRLDGSGVARVTQLSMEVLHRLSGSGVGAANKHYLIT